MNVVFVLCVILCAPHRLMAFLVYDEIHYAENKTLDSDDVILVCRTPLIWAYTNISIVWLYSGYFQNPRVIASATRFISKYGAIEETAVKLYSERVSFMFKVLGVKDASIYMKKTTLRDSGSYMCNAHNDNKGLLYNINLKVSKYPCTQDGPTKVTMSGCNGEFYDSFSALKCFDDGNKDSLLRFIWYARYHGDAEFHSEPIRYGQSMHLYLRAFLDQSWWGMVAEIKCVLQPPENCAAWKSNMQAQCNVRLRIPFNCHLSPPNKVSGADVVMCLDMSTSMGHTNFDLQKGLVRRVLTIIHTFNSSYVLSVCSFSDAVFVERLQPRKSLEDLIKITNSYSYQRFGTDIDKALLAMAKELLQRGRDGRQKIAVIITDGYSNNVTAMWDATVRLEKVDIKLVIVPFGGQTNVKVLKEFESRGHIVINNDVDSVKTAAKIVEQIKEIGSRLGRDRFLICDKREVENNEYYRLLSDKGGKIRPCPKFTHFERKTCECSTKTPDWHLSTCNNRGPLIYMPFDDDTNNTVDKYHNITINLIGSVVVVNNPGIRGSVGAGAVFFNGVSHIEIPFFKNIEFSELFVRFRYHQVACEHQMDHFSTIIAIDSDKCLGSPFRVVATNNGNARVTEINFSGDDERMRGHTELCYSNMTSWIDVEVAITPNEMKVKVGELDTVKIDFNNSISSELFRVENELTIAGGCRKDTSFSPMYIDELYVFDCIPYEI